VEIAGERSDLRSGIALARQSRPDILLLELGQPADETLAAAAQFRLDQPDCAIFMVTENLDPDTLLRAMRAGASEVLRRPLDRATLSRAVERVSALAARRSGTSVGRGVITVFSSKGGAGVSTIAANLALCLQRQNRRELVLADLDDQSGDAAFLLGLEPARSMADVLAAPRIDSASVQAALTRHVGGLCVLAQPEQLDQAPATADQAGTVVEILSSMFETVVIDAPHAFDDRSVEIFDRSTVLLLVVEPSLPSVRAARRSIEILHRLNFFAVPDRVRLVVNRRSDANSITLQQVEDTLRLQAFGTITNDYATASQAINLGRPLSLGSPGSVVAKDIHAIARKLSPADVAEDDIAEVPARKPAGLRLFGMGPRT
jgi:pilus assembly protein CpaE